MKWLKRILVALLVLIILVIGISFFLPKQAHFERSLVMNTTPGVVYGIVNNLKTYDKWMPWNQIDPNWKVTYSDTTVGTGAHYNWVSSHSDVGTGSLTIVESKPAELITTVLTFEGMGNSIGGWLMTPAAAATEVKWYMDMDMSQGGFMNQVMGKWMCSLGLMDKMLGPQFEKGLNSLKKLAESPEAAGYSQGNGSPEGYRFEFEEKNFDAAVVLTQNGRAGSSKEIAEQLGKIYQAIGECTSANGLTMTGAPIAAYKSQTAPYDFWGGILVDKKPAKPCSGIEVNELPAKKVAVCHFYGPYEKAPNGYVALEKWMKQHQKVADGSPIEQYVNDPTTVKPEDIQTDILWPVK